MRDRAVWTRLPSDRRPLDPLPMPRRMSLFPRLRQACRRDHRGPAASAGARVGQGSGAAADALRGHPPATGAAGARQGPDSRLALNRVFLSGVLADDPVRDRGRDGDRAVFLRVAFPAPDTRDTWPGEEAALEEIEVPEVIAERHGKELRVGESIFITGQLSGGGGVIATEIHSGPPPDSMAS